MPFKIYADFDYNLKKVKSSVKNGDRGDNTSYTENHKEHIPYNFTYDLVCFDDKCSKPVVHYREKNAVNKFIKAILVEYVHCKKVIKTFSYKFSYVCRR